MTPLDGLTCEDAFRRLDDYLDRALTPGEARAVQEHLEVCATCAREFRFEDAVLRALRERLAHLAVAPDLVQRVRRTVGRAAEDPPAG